MLWQDVLLLKWKRGQVQWIKPDDNRRWQYYDEEHDHDASIRPMACYSPTFRPAHVNA